MSSDTSAVTYAAIRQNIVDLLSAKDTFKDINFTAPAISTLIDALAYTSTYLLQYANFSIGECFLDSAQLRSSIVSRAKGLGYTPTQYTAAKNSIRLKVSNQSLVISTNDFIPSGTEFIASTGSKTYKFTTLETVHFALGSDGKWFVDLDIVEGTFVDEIFIQDSFYTTEYVLSNKQIDTRYLSVYVKENETAVTGIEYQSATHIEDISKESTVYYLEETYGESVRVYFGDGILGAKLKPYNHVTISYLVTSGELANDIIKYNLSTTTAGISPSDITITLNESVLPGASKESSESIKFVAPKMYQAQNRAVSASDYAAFIKSEFGSWIDGISVWGGEDNVPPQYGKVLLSIKPKTSNSLSIRQKEEIVNLLGKKKIPSIVTEFIDPSIIGVNLDTSVKWNPFRTNKIKTEIYDIVYAKIQSFFADEIRGFSSGFNYSTFISYVLSVNPSLISISNEIKLSQTFIPNSGIGSYSFYFNNEIKEGSVLIGTWTKLGASSTSIITDSGGYLYHEDKKIGTVNYASGKISIEVFDFSTAANTLISVRVIPVSLDVDVSKNFLLTLSNLNLTVVDAN